MGGQIWDKREALISLGNERIAHQVILSHLGTYARLNAYMHGKQLIQLVPRLRYDKLSSSAETPASQTHRIRALEHCHTSRLQVFKKIDYPDMV